MLPSFDDLISDQHTSQLRVRKVTDYADEVTTEAVVHLQLVAYDVASIALWHRISERHLDLSVSRLCEVNNGNISGLRRNAGQDCIRYFAESLSLSSNGLDLDSESVAFAVSRPVSDCKA